MSLKFQYNKTFLHQLGRELKVRESALPTLQAKEAALRLEVKRARLQLRKVEEDLNARNKELVDTHRLWGEFPVGMVTVGKVAKGMRKVAGVRVPVLETISFSVAPYSMVSLPAWVPMGIAMLKERVTLAVMLDIAKVTVAELERARRKTTQKVNLYEKVQIPEYRESIRKIKRFLEDDENLAKASQKILKVRLAAAEVAA